VQGAFLLSSLSKKANGLLACQRTYQKEKAGRVMQGGARGGGTRSDAPKALQGKDRGERSEDFWAAQQRKSNGIFEGCKKGRPAFLTA
jgi:hypothetical protein